MFNVYLFDKKVSERHVAERHTLQMLLQRRKKVSQRETLTANYARRVDRFIMNMANDPVEVRDYKTSAEVVLRASDPHKFKGPPRMVTGLSKSSDTSCQRLENRSGSGGVQKPYDFRPRDRTKELKPRRLKSKKTRTVPATEGNSAVPTPFEYDLSEYSDGGASTEDQQKPQASQTVFQGIDRKTHFKGVLSRLVETGKHQQAKLTEDTETFGPTFHRSRTASILWRHAKVLKREFLRESEGTALAKEILESCKIIPKVNASVFLRKGDGRIRSFNHLALNSSM